MKSIIRLLVLSLALAPSLLLAGVHDQKIEQAAQTSFNFRVILGNRVSVSAREGIVYLTGLVEDEEEKALALDTVAFLEGVVSVNNQLVISPVYTKFSDPWMARQIRTRLIAKGKINISDIGVTVKGGVATLTGTVDTMLQKELTESYALAVPKVVSIQNQLVVKAGNSGAKKPTEVIDDASISSQLRSAFRTDAVHGAAVIGIRTTEGVITLTGEASSEAQKAAISKQAESVRGVRSVNNQMTIKG